MKCELFNQLGAVKERLAIGRTKGAQRSAEIKPGQTEVEATSVELPVRKGGAKMVALTLLDGTTIRLPARPHKAQESIPPAPDHLTARDLIAALRAVSHGADASEILGERVPLEAMLAALLSILLKKGLIADWEFVDELRKV